MDIGPGARSAPVVTVVSQDQLQHVRRQRNSTNHHSNINNHSSSVGGSILNDGSGERNSISIDRDSGGAFSGGEDLSGSCVWLSSRLGETTNILLNGDAQSPTIDRNEGLGWNAERDDELSRLMWCEGDAEEEGGVTASEETNAEYGTAGAVARRSLGDVLGEHCLQNLIESPCSVAPEPHRQPARNGKKVLSTKAAKPAPKASSSTKTQSTASRTRVVQPAPVVGKVAPARRQQPVSSSSSLTTQKVDAHKAMPSAPIPFERQHARAHDSPSVLSNVMVQLSRDLAQRTLSGTFGGRTASPSVSPFENTAYGLDSTTLNSTIHKPSSKNIRDIRYTAVGRDGSAPRHADPTKMAKDSKTSEAWWERLAPKSPSRAVSANSSRRVSIVSASDMHCIAPRHEGGGSVEVGTRRRSASHSHMPTHLRQPARGFTQQAFRKDDSPKEAPRPQVQRRRSVSAQSSLRRSDGRDASFLRPTEASQSRKEAAALSSSQTKLATSSSSLSMSHTGFRQESISPPRAASAGRNQAAFERLYTHRTENTTNYIVSRHNTQHQHQHHPPAPSPSKTAPTKSFVPSCATRNDRRSHLAKVYNLPEPPPKAVPQVRRYVPKSKQVQSSPSPSRTSVSPTPSRSAGVRSPVGISRGQVLYEQTRTAQLARKQEVIAQAMSHNRRYDASHSGGSRRTSMGAASLSHSQPPPHLVTDNADLFVPLSGDNHNGGNMVDDSLVTPRSDAVPPSSPGTNHRSPKPSRLDLNALFVSTPVLHRSLQQENTHRPNHPTTPRAQHALSPYETNFDMPLRSPGGRADDGDVVAVAIPAVMDTL